MMQKRKNSSNFPEIKLFITTLSLTAIVAFWNLFAKQAIEAQNLDNSNSDFSDNHSTESLSEGILPTLVPLMINQAQQVSNNANDESLSISELEEVEAPAVAISEDNSAIVIDSINLEQPAPSQSDPKNQPQQSGGEAQAQPTVAATTSSSK